MEICDYTRYNELLHASKICSVHSFNTKPFEKALQYMYE